MYENTTWKHDWEMRDLELRIKRCLDRVVPILIILAIMVGMQQVINYLSYDHRGPSGVVVDWSEKIGLEEEFARMILWYAVQVALTLVFLRMLVRKPLRQIGFSMVSLKSSLRYIAAFVIGYPLASLTIWSILKSIGLNILPPELSDKSTAYLMKDFLCFGLLPGVGEEPFFRVFVIQFLASTTFRKADLDDQKTSAYLIILSGVLFALGHVFVSWSPFYLSYDVLQMLTAFILGLFYAFAYIHTKSILVPVVTHNYSDLVHRLATFFLG